MDIVLSFLVTTAIIILLYIITNINNPKTTRRDIRKGKSVSLLVFVQSHIQMQKIFDPDTDERRESNQLSNSLNKYSSNLD